MVRFDIATALFSLSCAARHEAFLDGTTREMQDFVALLPYDVAMELAESFAACGWNALVHAWPFHGGACSVNL